MANPRWQVHHYQVGCAKDKVGEAAILIVEDRGSNPTALTVGTVHKAILIDGGQSSHAVGNIMDTMGMICEEFGMDSLKFDAVVITHWDQDHFWGFCKSDNSLVKNDFTGFDGSSMIQCFQYDETVTPPKPLTKIYCPYWGWSKAATGVLKGQIKATGQSTIIDSAAGSFDVQLNLEGFPNINIATGIADPQLLLGTNIINGRQLPSGTLSQNVSSLDQLLTANSPWLDATGSNTAFQGCPGLYIFGARGQSLGSAEDLTQPSGVALPSDATSSPVGAVNTPPTKAEMKTKAYVANISSVMMLLVWQADGSLPHRISLYTGGDAEWQNEVSLASWVTNPPQPIEAIKLGHHGSVIGTAPQLLDAASPQTFLVSAGFDHNHPRPEIIWELDAYLRSQKASGVALPNRSLWPTCFAYWLGRTDKALLPVSATSAYTNADTLDIIYLSLKFGSTDTDGLNFINKLHTWYTAAGLGTGLPTPQQTLDQNLTTKLEYEATSAKNDPDVKAIQSAKIALQVAQATHDPQKIADAVTALNTAEVKYRKGQGKGYRAAEFSFAATLTEMMWNGMSLIGPDYAPYDLPAQKANNSNTKKRLADQMHGQTAKSVRCIHAQFCHDPSLTLVRAVDNEFQIVVDCKKRRVEPKKAKLSLAIPQPGNFATTDGSPTDVQIRRTNYISPTWDVQLDLQAAFQFGQTQSLVDSGTASDRLVSNPVHMGTDTISPPSSPTDSEPPSPQDDVLPLTNGDSFVQLSKSDDTATQSFAKIPASYATLDDFAASLDQGALVLETPALTSVFDSPWKLILSSTSDLVTWFENSFDVDASGVNLVSVQASIVGPGPNAGAVSFLSGFEVDVTYNSYSPMVFSSKIADVASAAGGLTPADVSPFIGPEGLLLSSPGLVLGLVDYSQPATSPWTMQDLFGFIVGPLTTTSMSSSTTADMPIFVNPLTTMAINAEKVNCIWFSTIPDYLTTLRLSASSTAAASDGVQPFIPSLPNCQCKTVTFHGRRIMTRGPASSSSPSSDGVAPYEVTAETEVTLEVLLTLLDGATPLSDFQLFVTFSTTGISVVLRPQPDTSVGDVLCHLTTWILGCLPTGATFYDSTAQTWLNNMAGTNSIISIRQAVVNFDLITGATPTTSSWQFASATLMFEVDLSWGIDSASPPNTSIPTLMTFSYTRNNSNAGAGFSFTGSLWSALDSSLDWNTSIRQQAIKPRAQIIPPLVPLSNSGQTQYYISLKSWLANHITASFPQMIPDEITKLDISLSAQGLAFRGILSRPLESTSPITISYITLAVNTPFPGSQGSLQASFGVSLQLSDRFQQQPAQVCGEISYDGSLWTLSGSAQSLQVSNLYTLFPNSDGDAVMNALDGIEINDLEITYSFDSAGATSGFDVLASLIISGFELDLTFSYHPSVGQDWSFNAILNVDSVADDDPTGGTSLGDVLRAVSPSAADSLPSFLDQFEIGLTASDHVSIYAFKALAEPDSNMLSYITTVFTVETQHIEFSYLQLSPTTAGSDDQAGLSTKRVLRLILKGPNQLPSFTPISSVPFLSDFDNLNSPFERLELLWTNQGLTKQDIDVGLNPIYARSEVNIDPILYQDPATQTRDPSIVTPASPQTSQILAQGTHIMIVAEKNRVPTLILDYSFTPDASGPPPANVAGQATEKTSANLESGGGGDEDDNGSVNVVGFGGDDPTPALPVNTSPTAAAMTNQQGMFSISGLSIGYDTASQHVEVKFNARVQLGALEADLQGFGITFPVTLFQDRNLTEVSVTISGMAFALNKAPISVAGDLLNLSTSQTIQFLGGLSVNVDPYSFIAAGYYGDFSNYRSMFVFAQLQGPFLELEFGTLSGLTAGFGYHSDLTLPTIDDVTKFPFLGPVSGTTAFDILTSLTSSTPTSPAWFSPSNGPIWFAAGLTAKLFQALSIDAVVVVDMQQNDTILGIFADCQASIPAGEPDLFVFVDMGIVATVDFGKGTLQVEGQLTPKSFVFSPSCKLTGGFAFCYWFDGSGHEGDWVFTVGGYHPAFVVPAYYPNPNRLAITWTYDSNLTISGDAYFAITPKVCMGGGALTLNWHSGALSATLFAYADFLINFKPFHYMIDAGVDVRASFTIGWGRLSHTFHLDASATIAMNGPPLAGVAHINWTIISFDVKFGNQSSIPDLLLWPDFVSLLQQNQVQGLASSPDYTPSSSSVLAVKATNGILSEEPDTTSTTGTTWVVDGTSFTFRMVSLVALQSIAVNGKVAGSLDTSFYFKPMGDTDQRASTASITVVDTEQGAESLVFSTASTILKNAPKGIWDIYDKSQDPSYGTNLTSLNSNTGATVQLAFGLDLDPPDATDQGDVYTVPGTTMYVDCAVKTKWDLVDPPSLPTLAPPTVPDTVTIDLNSYLPTTSATAAQLQTSLCNDQGQPDSPVSVLIAEWLKLAAPNQPNSTFATNLNTLATGRTTPGATLYAQDCSAGIRAFPLIIA